MTQARRNFLLQSLTWALAGTPLTAFAATPEEIAQLARAETRMKGLDNLGTLARDTDQQASDLAWAAQLLREHWDDTINLHAQLEPAIATVRRTLKQLDTELTAGNDALRAQADAAAESRRTATRLANAPLDRMSEAATESDTAFTRRHLAEAALQAQQRRIGIAANACADALNRVRSLITRCSAEARQADSASRALHRDFAALRDGATKMTDTARDARSAGWLNHTIDSLPLPDGQAVDRLYAALGSAPPGGELPANDIAQFFEGDNDGAALAAALTREEDAASVRALMLPLCTGDACATLQAEQDEHKADLAQAQANLADLQKRLAALRLELPTIPEAPQRWADTMRAWLDPISSTVSPALDEAKLAVDSIKAVTAPLADAADKAYEHARAEWIAAYRVAYGTTPPSPTQAGSYSAASTAAAATTASTTLTVVRSHAYERVSVLDGERNGFGAYTYVLLRSARDLDAKPVARRYALLLDLLEGELPEAGAVSAKAARNINLFCIPVAASDATTAKGGQPRYGASLAGQWLLNAQHGLLTRKELLTRLIRSPGPFLLTLPGRITESTPGMPLLFADLNDYADLAIQDLVTQYMADLLETFPKEQAQWKPPATQQVALTMIHLAGDLGRIVERVIPTATAGGH